MHLHLHLHRLASIQPKAYRAIVTEGDVKFADLKLRDMVPQNDNPRFCIEGTLCVITRDVQHHLDWRLTSLIDGGLCRVVNCQSPGSIARCRDHRLKIFSLVLIVKVFVDQRLHVGLNLMIIASVQDKYMDFMIETSQRETHLDVVL
jgi:hypothetical protein